MYHHKKSITKSISQDLALSLFQSIFHKKIKKDELFELFMIHLQTTYRSCIEIEFPKDKAYLVRCFVQVLDKNKSNVRDLLDTNVLDWFDKVLDEVTQLTTDIK